MARWKDYTRKQTPSEADEVMLLDTDGKANKRTTLKELARTIGNTGGFPDVDDTLTKPGMAADAKTVGDQIKQIAQQMEDLQYVPIEILSFSNNVGIAELGSVINEITLNWELNKTPETVILNGQIMSSRNSVQSVILKDAALKENKTFTLLAVDDRDNSAQKNTGITFYNGIYYGVAGIPTELDSAFIRSLSRSLQANRTKIFTIDSGADQYVWYALPTRYGAPVFNVGGFDGGFAKVSALSFMNLSGYTEEYIVYRSDNSSIGKKTVKVT
jgi:hypothetical protein